MCSNHLAARQLCCRAPIKQDPSGLVSGKSSYREQKLDNTHYKAPPWLLRSRITPPALLTLQVERPRLMQLFEAGAEQSVTIEAPAGFGKSVLAAQWCQRTACSCSPS